MSQRWDERPATIRFEIEGRWSVPDMGQFFLYLDDLYELYLGLLIARNESYVVDFLYIWKKQNPRISLVSLFRRLSKRVVKETHLEIVRVEFASPGVQDLAGIGVIVGHIKEIVLKLIDVAVTTRERRLRNDRLEIENLEAEVELALRLGYTEKEIRNFIVWVKRRQKGIYKLVAQGKIQSVKELSHRDNHK